MRPSFLTHRKLGRVFLLFLIFSFAGATAKGGLILSDNFNDGYTAGWTPTNGIVSESGGRFGGTNNSFALFDGGSGSKAGVDAISGNSVGYVAIGLNVASNSDMLFSKLQDNSGDGRFDRIFFFDRNNSANLISVSFALSSEFDQSYFELRDNLDGTASAYVAATNQTFTITLGRTFTGTGIGLGFNADATADNFYSQSNVVPEPTTMMSFLCLAGIALRRRRKSPNRH